MNVSFYIAKRYLFSKSSTNAINIISRIATFGVVMIAMALFVVLATFDGLKSFNLSFIQHFDPDIKISAKQGKSFLFNDSIATKLAANADIAHYSKTLEERAYFNYRKKKKLAYIKGVDSLFTQTIAIDSTVYIGGWLVPNTTNTVVGSITANALGIGINDYRASLDIYIPKAGKGQITNPANAFRRTNTAPIGVYNINPEIDGKYVFANLPTVQRLLGYKNNQINAIEIKLKPSSNPNKVKEALEKALGKQYKIQTRIELNSALYKMLNSENLFIYGIAVLVLIIALFNVIGSIMMLILDKKDNLKTLNQLGLPFQKIRKVFLLQGVLLTVLGGVLGIVLGIIIVFLQQQFQLVMITSYLAYPVEFHWTNVLIVFLTLTILGYFASWIASASLRGNEL